MKIHKAPIAGCFLFVPESYRDNRGEFMETYNHREFLAILGEPLHFVQDNQSISKKFVLRGLHYQTGAHAQAKLARVISGRVLDVVVDIRKDSPTFGEYFSTELSARNRKTIFIPKGLAHGFLALEDNTIFSYKCDAFYNPESERGIIYNDPDLKIDWQIEEEKMILSEKDLALPRFNEEIL
ncbi:dTDP-4-dehydrorhamnose 3,5-epimerase [Robiginitalea aurantiaca]|uniref:dTDP-4-dehydrorhamnose 3,5-epimerase n=1 Tax=Robiginitalea aurantiaca TaxID=3056915 RepID=A0ABT7WAE4_9FLAO|nr:dTDP-4-dehydrorhamnose 3,5-epimerase [Robiginitalea aurantiaca]MDM9629893.1 dTDP-4-dehydrorhamnose 3,5-epimerase [Robiginitalea aurantiaca]